MTTKLGVLVRCPPPALTAAEITAFSTSRLGFQIRQATPQPSVCGRGLICAYCRIDRARRMDQEERIAIRGRTHDHVPFRLLRTRRERPSGSRAAEQRDELATLHSITSSASASRLGGISRPSAFAVLRLTANSNLVGCWTGSSLGFSPRRMRST